jgi:hypothetical protein
MGIGVQVGTELDVQAAFTEVDSRLLTIFYTDMCPTYGSLGGENKVVGKCWRVLT